MMCLFIHFPEGITSHTAGRHHHHKHDDKQSRI
ncbi:hypothetical protein EPIR_2754 [Erwinia piriflorinigrans CFBP 5888]|uniref:Uncharacterized protein n=1 Tax=Erwinia piriflorinigrans CFBP 5888 TaxID=1161919 RepID=V5ZAQ7_9GAMM|nr:hypothetical protein EPIR_2754 [Erwinia piriflorinigrans CFBP 5888]